VESELGKRESVHLYLLLAAETKTSSRWLHLCERPWLLAASGRLTPLVLLVDDEGPSRRASASYLEPEYRIAHGRVRSGRYPKAQQLRPDAITLDVLMPGSTGLRKPWQPCEKTRRRLKIPVHHPFHWWIKSK